MKLHILPSLLCAAFLATSTEVAPAQQAGKTFDEATAALLKELAASRSELAELRAQMEQEIVPLSRGLRELESEHQSVGRELQSITRDANSRALSLSNLTTESKRRKDETFYVSNLLTDYIRDFQSRVHIAELQRYRGVLEAAQLAPENENLSALEVFEQQAALLDTSVDRLFEALGGTSFEGTAVDSSGLVARGTFTLVGPAGLFLSADGRRVGTAEQRLGSLEPAAIPFASPEEEALAAAVVRDGAGTMPLDPTLGDAHKIEATQETLVQHVKKGGPIMIPILAMAGAALLVALLKWLSLAFLRRPSDKQVRALLSSVDQGDEAGAQRQAAALPGPEGRMLVAGTEHLREPRELVEEVMYETVLKSRLKLQRWLPFISIAAASAPLMGLLGTVTGIINTFKMITVFGSGDVKSLSGGISEALITTEFGLIVAIPSLLLHAFLSRKVKRITGHMESTAVAFANRVERSAFGRAVRRGAAREAAPTAPDPELVREQVTHILTDLLGPVLQPQPRDGATPAPGAGPGRATHSV